MRYANIIKRNPFEGGEISTSERAVNLCSSAPEFMEHSHNANPDPHSTF